MFSTFSLVLTMRQRVGRIVSIVDMCWEVENCQDRVRMGAVVNQRFSLEGLVSQELQ